MNKLQYLISYLKSEYPNGCSDFSSLNEFDEFRSLVNIRPPMSISKEFLDVQNEVLRKIIRENGITDIADLKKKEKNVYLYKGDITGLKCGAIVNAANSGMTGCYRPRHGCVDNAVHTFAGVQLRLECAEIMRRQGYPEPVGTAKLTSSYNLPCDYIIHTVGPMVKGKLTENLCLALEECYRSCLRSAVINKIDSIAFCCISTGEFGFPSQKAAEIAVATVRDFLGSHEIKVIFNVFKDKDYEIYKRLLI